MNAHLTDQELNAYLHQTLNDAQRETLDAHLTGCPTCRAHLSELNVLQQRVRRELTAELKAANVPLSLMFEAIAPRLKHKRRFIMPNARSHSVALLAIAATAVIVVLTINLVTRSNHLPTPSAQPMTNSTAILPATEDTTASIRFGGGATLVKPLLTRDKFIPGEEIPLTLFWYISAPANVNYYSFVNVLDKQGHLVVQADFPLHGADIDSLPPTQANYTVDPDASVLLPFDLPPGQYQVVVGIYNTQSGQRLTTDQGETAVPIGTIEVLTPLPSLVHFGNVATLTHARWSPDELKPGESLELSLRWIVSATNPVTLNTFVHLVDPQGNIVAQSDQPLTDVGTSVQTVTLQLPTSLVSGTYQIVTGVYDSTTFKRLTIDEDKLGVQLTVFIVGTITADPLHWPQERRFGDVATLINTSLSDTRFKPGDTLTLDLSWDISRAEGYASFVHVLDAQDQVVAQADLSLESIKAKNVRGQPNVPYLIGQSKIQLPADLADGEYHIAVGIYDNQTGQRVINDLGQTMVMITSFEVGPDLIVTTDTKHVHLVNPPQGYSPPVESHFEVAIRNACADLGCETLPVTCVGSSCSPYSPALTVTVYVDPKATSLYGWMYEDQLMFKVPQPDTVEQSQSVFDVPDSLTLLVEKVARSVYGWPPQTVSGLPIFSGIVAWETYQLDQRLGSAKLSNPFQPDRLAGTTLPPLESLWVPGPNVSETREMQAEAAALIAFVEKEFGASAVGKLLQAIGSANSLPEAIESGLNIKYTDFEQRWRDWLTQYGAN